MASGTPSYPSDRELTGEEWRRRDFALATVLVSLLLGIILRWVELA